MWTLILRLLVQLLSRLLEMHSDKSTVTVNLIFPLMTDASVPSNPAVQTIQIDAEQSSYQQGG